MLHILSADLYSSLTATSIARSELFNLAEPFVLLS